jgi:hypothetical protein
MFIAKIGKIEKILPNGGAVLPKIYFRQNNRMRGCAGGLTQFRLRRR